MNDWLVTGGIIAGVFALTAVISLFIPKDRDPEIRRQNGDGPVIPDPGPDGSVMGLGGANDGAEPDDTDIIEVEDGHGTTLG